MNAAVQPSCRQNDCLSFSSPKINIPFKSHAAKYIVHIPLQTRTYVRMKSHFTSPSSVVTALALLEEMDPWLVFDMRL